MSSRHDLVSVIVPCYNQAAFLPDAIRSLQGQTHENWECIIVNDGSTDATMAVATGLAGSDARIRVVAQENRGLAAARNRGLREVRGAFVQFLDADDALQPSKFRAQLDALGAGHVPGVAICDYYFSSATDLGEELPQFFKSARLETGNPWLELARRWETSLSIPCHCFLFDARFFTERGIAFDEELPNHEDWECWMRIFALNPPCHYVAARLAVYRFHAHSLSRNRDAMGRGFLQAIGKLRRRFRHDKAMRDVLSAKAMEVRAVYWPGRRDFGHVWLSLRGRLAAIARAVLPGAWFAELRRRSR